MADFILEAHCAASLGDFNLNLNFRMGNTFAALFGPSGCGKTSTLKVLAGLINPQKGFVSVGNQTVYDAEKNLCLPAEKRNIGLVFQDARLFPHLTVLENLKFGLRYTPVPKRRFTIENVVDILRISHLMGRKPDSLSGGESQRVAIGRALLVSPQLLLMDEPLAALDVPAKLSLLAELHNIHRVFQLPIIYVSHDIGTVLNIAAEILLMQNGEVIQKGPPAAVLQDYVSTRLLAGETIRNIFEVLVEQHDEAAGTTVVTANGVKFVLPRLSEAPGARFRLDIPASEIILSLEQPQKISARNILRGRVLDILRLGNRILVRVDTGIPIFVEVVAATIQTLQIVPGIDAYLVIKATAFRRLQ